MKNKRVKKLNTPMLASIGAGVLVFILFLTYLFSSGILHRRETNVVLPSGESTAPTISPDTPQLTAQQVASIEIDAQNAKQIIASLIRPDEYSCLIQNKLLYQGGDSSLSCRQYVRDEAMRIDTLSGDAEVLSTLLRANDAVYAWDRGETRFYKGVWGDFSGDAAAMMPSYEDVLSDTVAITAAARQDVDSEPCIRVEFDLEGMHCVYYISASSGLLKTASFYKGGVLVRQVTVSELQTETPDASLFVLPNGVSVLGES